MKPVAESILRHFLFCPYHSLIKLQIFFYSDNPPSSLFGRMLSREKRDAEERTG